MSIHKQIKDARLAKKWSMGDLADAITKAEGLAKPLTWQTVQQWEREDGTAPKRKRMALVANLLGLNLLSIGNEGAHPPPARSLRTVSDSQWAMLQDFEILPDKDKQSLRATMREKAETVRQVYAEFTARQGVGSAPASDARVEEAYGAPPAAPTGAGSYKRITPLPDAPKPDKQEGEG